MKKIRYAVFVIAVMVMSGVSAFAQESQTKVVDEVVAQINDSVITLSRVGREIRGFIDSLVQDGKTREQATAEVEAKRGEIIANMINEELLLEKAKETGLDNEIDARVNESLLQNMRELNLKSLDELFATMQQNGVNPEDIKEFRRKDFAKNFVLQREVDSRLYNGWKAREIQAYFEANKTKFTTPESFTISEIYLSFAGKDPDAVRSKGAEVVGKAKIGFDFEQLALENSERPDVQTSKGKAGKFNVKDLDPKFAKPLEGKKVGDIVGPIEIDNVGIEIIRIDEHQLASSESVYDENEVRKMMTLEKIPEERKNYLVKLREDNYIKVKDSYRPEVMPILYAEELKTEADKPQGN